MTARSFRFSEKRVSGSATPYFSFSNIMDQDFSFYNAFMISLPHGNKVLSPNASVPKTAKGVFAMARKKQKARRTARMLAWAVALEALAGRMVRPNRYMVRWFYKYGDPPDDDNAVGRCKAYMDGACLAMGINDRDLRLVGVERVKDLVRFREVELVFWQEEEDFDTVFRENFHEKRMKNGLKTGEQTNEKGGRNYGCFMDQD